MRALAPLLVSLACASADAQGIVPVGFGGTGGAEPGGSIITPDVDLLAFDLSDTTTARTIADCAAPCGVHFDATATTATGKNLQDITVVWDFGDTNAGTVPRGGINRDLNVLYQPAIAFHSYEPQDSEYDDDCGAGANTCAIFIGSATFYAVDSGSVVSEQLTFAVQVEKPSTTWAGAATDCYGAASTGCPAGADYIGATPDFSCTASRQILFERGSTFTMSATPTLSSANRCRWAFYGTGADPIIDVTATSGAVFDPPGTCGFGTRVVGIDFDGPGSGTIDFMSGGKCLLLHDVDVAVSGAGNQFNNLMEAGDNTPETPDNSQLYFYKLRSAQNGITGGGAVSVFFCTCEFTAFVGGEISGVLPTGGAGNVEHNIRNSWFHKNIYAYNVLADDVGTKDLLDLRGDADGNADSRYAAVIGNQFSVLTTVALKIGETNSGACDTETNTTIEHVWVYGNTFDVESDTGSRGMIQAQVCGDPTTPGVTDRLTIYGNYINWSNKPVTASGAVTLFDQISSGGTGSKDNHRVSHNALIYNGTNTITVGFIVTEFGSTTGAVCANNHFSLKMTGVPTLCTNTVTILTNHDESDASPADDWSVTAGYPTGFPVDFDDVKIAVGDPGDSTGTALLEPPYVIDPFGNSCPNGSAEIGVHCIAD